MVKVVTIAAGRHVAMASVDRTGIYCLANDRVLDWVLALLESRLVHEPDLPLVVIPFDDDVAQLRGLTETFAFELLEGDELSDLDRLARALWPDAAETGRLRKLAAFTGRFETFLFLDADVVVLDQLGHLFTTFTGADCDLLFADADLDWVYRPGPLRDELVAQGAPGANTGVFLSRRGVISGGDLRALAPELVRRVPELATRDDQSVINLCLDRLGRRARRLSDADPAIAMSAWAGATAGRRSATCASHCDETGRWLPLLHWAGFPLGGELPHAELLRGYRRRAQARLDGRPVDEQRGSLTRIAPASHGLGLLATADLAAGTVVARWMGPIVGAARVPENEVRNVLDLGGDRFLIPTTEARLVNHSCDPNCAIGPELEVVTTRAVSRHEELTYHYALVSRDELEQARPWDPRWSFDCRCGSPGCLGRIDRFVAA